MWETPYPGASPGTLSSNPKPCFAKAVRLKSTSGLYTFRTLSPSKKLRPTHTHCPGSISNSRRPQACLRYVRFLSLAVKPCNYFRRTTRDAYFRSLCEALRSSRSARWDPTNPTKSGKTLKSCQPWILFARSTKTYGTAKFENNLRDRQI